MAAASERPMTKITLRIGEDVVTDLKQIAPLLGFGGYQPLIRAYVSQGLRRDLELLSIDAEIPRLLESLRRHGVDDETIASALAEARESE